MSLAGKERNLGTRSSPLTGLSPGGVSTCRMNSPGRSIRWRTAAVGQVSAESHASQQGQPEENDMDRVPAPPPVAAGQ
jgi:hypothetical protein